MKQIFIDNYNFKCIMNINDEDKEIIFCKNDFDVTFIYLDGILICIFVPENTPPYIAEDIKRLYNDKTQIISMGYLHEISFSYGLILGMIREVVK